eukprot:3559492-Rhodomonas_salina.1
MTLPFLKKHEFHSSFLLHPHLAFPSALRPDSTHAQRRASGARARSKTRISDRAGEKREQQTTKHKISGK